MNLQYISVALSVLLFSHVSAAPYVVRIENGLSQTPSATIISGTDFSLVAASEPGCAIRIIHGNVTEKFDERGSLIGEIKSNNITVNGVTCTASLGGDPMRIYTQDTVPMDTLPRVPLALLENGQFFAGDAQPRNCDDYADDTLQGYVFSQNASVFLPPLEKYHYIDNLDVIPLQYRQDPDAFWMVSATASFGIGQRGRLCVYYASLSEKPKIKEDDSEEDLEESSQLLPSPEDTTKSILPEEPTTDPALDSADEKKEVPLSFERAVDDTEAAGNDLNSKKKSCFPADALVTMQNGSTKRMDQLQIGDVILSTPGIFSEVILFSHSIRNGAWKFIQIMTKKGAVIEASVGHYIHVNGHLIAAGSIRIGDTITRADGSVDIVAKISTVIKSGLYNPQTIHGDIVVGDILASTYTTGVYPTTAHAFLVPIRALAALFKIETSILNNGAESIASWMPQGPSIF